MTNGEKIRSMTDEELAKFFCSLRIECGLCIPWEICKKNIQFYTCSQIWGIWLKSEAEDD